MNRWAAMWKRMRARTRTEHELDAEVRVYFDEVVDEKIARGMPREAARRAAALELGGREQVKEAVRDVRFGVWVENLARDLAQGARLLAKSPGFTAVAVLTLAVGMGPNIAIFSFLNGILLQPLPYPQPEQLVQIFHTNPKFVEGGDTLPVSPPTFNDWRSQSRTLDVAAAAETSHVLTNRGAGEIEPERVAAAGVSTNFFATLGVAPHLGPSFSAGADQPNAPPEIVLSYGVWQRRLGGRTSVVGESLEVSGKPHTIVGVMPRGFSYPAGVEIWIPLAFDPGEMKERSSLYLDVTARLKPNATIAQAQAEIAAITQRVLQDLPAERDFGARVAPLHGEMVREVQPSLLLLFSAVALVLLIACVNVANLLLARGAARSRDLAVRAALGAGRARLMQQLLGEGLLIALAGGVLGLLVAGWSLEALRSIVPTSMPRVENVRMDAGVVLFSLGLAVLTTVLFGLMPAWQGTRVNLSDSLKEGARGTIGGGRHRMRGGLVVAEVCLSLILLTGAGLMLRTLWQVLSVNPGFDPRNVLTAELYLSRGKYNDDAKRAQFAREILRQTRAIPGVEAAGLTTQLPLAGGQMTYGFLKEGQSDADIRQSMPGTKGNPQTTNLRFVSSDYFQAMRIPVLRGRPLQEADVIGAPEVVVVNQAMAEQFWPGEDVLGKQIRLARGREPAWRTIVGVVGNIRHTSLTRPPEAEAYVSWGQQTLTSFRLTLRTVGDPAAIASPLRQAVWAVDKDQPVSRVRPMETVLLRSVSETRLFAVLFGVFAGVALLLAAFGIYSVMAYSVTQRSREMGIRLALGARVGQVEGMVLREGLLLALAGVVLGTGGALFATRWVEKLLYGVERTDPATFAGVTMTLLLAAAVACYLPARRATRVDPLVALRHD